MRIRDLAFKTGRAGNWSSEDQDVHYFGYAGIPTDAILRVRVVKHYTTTMLVLGLNLWDTPTGEVLDYSLGHHSVSDQQGVNQILRAINAPLYFSRKGGAKMKEVSA